MVVFPCASGGRIDAEESIAIWFVPVGTGLSYSQQYALLPVKANGASMSNSAVWWLRLMASTQKEQYGHDSEAEM